MNIECLNAGAEFPHLNASALLLKDCGLLIAVDCGERSSRPTILRRLAARNISCLQIEMLILTHLHFDHCENADLFERALIVVHWREVEFLERLLREQSVDGIRERLKSHYETIPDFYLRAIIRKLTDCRKEYEQLLSDRGRLYLIDTDRVAVGGLDVVNTSGHSIGHLAVGVPNNPPVWIAGDAVISLRAWNKPQLPQQQLCWSADRQREVRQTIETWDGVLIPGHGLPFDIRSGESVPFQDLE